MQRKIENNKTEGLQEHKLRATIGDSMNWKAMASEGELGIKTSVLLLL